MENDYFNFAFAAILMVLATNPVRAADVQLLNVSYDPTRELYKEYNPAFARYWKARRPMWSPWRSAMTSIQLYKKRRLIPENWQSLLPNNSAPYTSTIVFLVRKGNPLGIRDWNDIVKPDVSIVTPNPKTSGGARWNYLAAWAYALKTGNNDAAAAQAFVARLYKNVALLDTSARGATTTFVERDIGDVLIAWENEAYLVLKEFGPDRFEIVTPSLSILAEPPVAIVEDIARKHGTTDVATEYLKYLYSTEGQEIVGKNFYRPADRAIAARYAKQFQSLELVKIDKFGGWDAAQKRHFADDGVFDQISGAGK